MDHNHSTSGEIKTNGNLTDYPLNWPSTEKGSTHELAITKEHIFVTGQNMDMVAKLDYDGNILAYYNMPTGSGPHGLLIDDDGRLWVSLEFKGTVAQLDDEGTIVQEIDVNMVVEGSPGKINPAPHGIGLGPKGEYIWFTGKRTSTVGKFNMATHEVEHYELENLASLPIFLSAGAQNTVWGTELKSNAILKVAEDGSISEFTIPTSNSRPIGVIPDPTEDYMWFTEEAGVNVGRIDMDGNITEFPVPALQKNDILASLTFDEDHNLWVQVYVDHNDPNPTGPDYLIKFDKSIRTATGDAMYEVPYSIHVVPTRMTMMHRIKMDSNGNLWYTEMMTDTVGVIRF
jgi:virginiamycin B lyase